MGPLSDSPGRITEYRDEVLQAFPFLWHNMVTEWNQPGAEDRAWLMYSANYLFRTGGIRWAIDPVRLKHRLPNAPEFPWAAHLEQLSFVLLTHRHADHLDLALIRALSGLPATWVVPEPLLEKVTGEGRLSPSQILVPQPMQPLQLHGIRVTPFDGMHWEEVSLAPSGGPRGVPAFGYLLEFGAKRWLLPGDTRTYDASRLPRFGRLDGLFAHLWLGRRRARDVNPPLLDKFCRWCTDLHPGRVVLTHLQEFGRAPDDYWDTEHAELVACKMRELNPSLPVSHACMGDSVLL